MSVSTVEAGVIRIGDGITTVFPFSFEAGAASDIKVSNIVGVALVPVLSGFTVFLNPSGTGGTITFSSAPANLQSFYIFRETALTQNVSVSSQQKYDPKVAENVWDKLTFLIQELSSKIDRAVLTAPGEDSSDLVNIIVLAAAAVTAGNVGLAPNGTVASPGYAFVGEPSLGFLRASAGIMQAAVSGAARLELSATALKLLVSILKTNAVIVGGTNAQGQAPLVEDHNVITSTPNNPSAVTLPVATAGRDVTVVNRGTNPLNVYPAISSFIGSLAANAPVLVPVGHSIRLIARDAAQWEGQVHQPYDAKLTELAAPAYVRGDLIRRGASTLERLALGTTDFVLTSDGTDAIWRRSGARVLLTTKIAANSPTIDITEFNNAIYKSYDLEIERFLPVTDGANLLARTSTNGGGAYDAGASDYYQTGYNMQGTTGPANEGSVAASSLKLNGGATGIGNAAGELGLTGRFRILNPGDAGGYASIEGKSWNRNTAGALHTLSTVGERVAAQDMDAFRLFMSTGNVLSGVARLYGYPQ